MKTTGKLLIIGFSFLALAANAYAADDSALFKAVDKGDKVEVEALLTKGADVNARDMSDTGRRETPLHHAAFYGHKDICELLLAKGADLIAKDLNGNTPTMWAAHNKKYDVMSYLNKQETLLGEQREQRLKQARLFDDLIKTSPRVALVQMTTWLKGDPADDNIRRLIIKLASELKPAPAIPEEARKHFVEGTAIVKAAKNPAQQVLAAQSFGEALKVAPWWGDAYYNLGVAQELAEKYDEAEKAFYFYLLTNASATEKREVQDRIYALSAKRKLLGTK